MEIVDPLIRKLSHRGELTDEEREFLRRSVSRVRDVPADSDIVAEGARPTESTLLVSGFAARYINVASGKRQIVAIHVAGDFVDLHGFLLKQMDHGIYAMCPCRIALFPHERIHEITDSFPSLTRQLWLNTLVDAAIHRQWLAVMGRRPAQGQIAHLICELYVRLAVAGQTDGYEFALPITQEELADSLGMSLVHLSRSLQELRNSGLLDWGRNRMKIKDWERLKDVAEFDGTYLNLEPEAAHQIL